MNELDASNVIAKLGLQPHPEGGYYRETYRAPDTIQIVDREGERRNFTESRSVATGIYFLIPAGEKSTWHRIDADEMWHFYAGKPLQIAELHPDGRVRETLLGSDPAAGHTFQHVVPAGCWFASQPVEATGYALVGCTVSPGFSFDAFELADKQILLDGWPDARELIESLAR